MLHDDLPVSIAGLSLTLTALTTVALILLYGWITDAREERGLLSAAQCEAQAEKSRYVALQAALEAEQGRRTQDRAAERRADQQRLKVERDAMERQFEEQRASLIAETMEATFMMIHNGKFASAEPTRSKVIQFPRDLPHQQPQGHPERERSREHGVVGP
ncbi:hypothetical protein [Streptomyces griseorubiginosus]|uniref:hypothetical protein n=1 Tax=Streptomyces griseorubiginosus TaxID=67304 RepID=UPI0036E3F55B